MAAITTLPAMDRAASVRRMDANGYLHVETSNLTKANVCPYMGAEIPGWEELGLEKFRTYKLYRDPDELKAAVETFNNIPVVSKHIPVIPENLPQEYIIGSTGTDAEFNDPYVENSLVIWSAADQDKIFSNEKREISSSYQYRPDMTPGTSPDGDKYDGVMRDIRANHVALVFEGRAGPDVLVGDEAMTVKSRTALKMLGAVEAHIRPMLAADAKVNLADAFAGVTASTMAEDGAPGKLAAAILKAAAGSFASGKAPHADALAKLLRSVSPLAMDEDTIREPKKAEDEEEDEDERKRREKRERDEKRERADDDEEDDDKEKRERDKKEEAERRDRKKAEDDDDEEDEDDDGEKRRMKKGAMDAAAIEQRIAAAERRAVNRTVNLATAREIVRPLIGAVTCDSARQAYNMALIAAGYDNLALDNAPLATLRAMTQREVARKSRGSAAADSARMAAAADSYEQLYGRK